MSGHFSNRITVEGHRKMIKGNAFEKRTFLHLSWNRWYLFYCSEISFICSLRTKLTILTSELDKGSSIILLCFSKNLTPADASDLFESNSSFQVVFSELTQLSSRVKKGLPRLKFKPWTGPPGIWPPRHGIKSIIICLL